MPAEIPTGWEARCTRLWEEFPTVGPVDFRREIAELVHELPEGHPVGLFEWASACDATDLEAEAVRHYRAALAGGLGGERRRQAVIQLASTLRNLGEASESVRLLTEEKGNGQDQLDDAVDAFLALALIDLGREREAAALTLGALARHLPQYSGAVARYARDVRR
ncbi:tetratricopeptide repeat protein [Streptomyces alkaliterrae]|uniref:Tetratricopeptide repeat protein n=1 Tax=Streptomyces alkaliterrae TaxID=2213162 RepID=A0A5P0YSY7_9ACTN|nr:tetratricopeptide repeat protein [Streptomyces alkaliterrae]MBB1260151.1 tetratricopeptide repeat protein [Streptomyces alkaliterrae]MQS03020.1 tetratricopeptide repeat protein [Streptomyces alkaliterrae]